MVSSVLEALAHSLAPATLLLILFGATAGMALGAMPGLTAMMGLALLVPFTFTMEPVTGLILAGAIYMGAIYGGAFTAILVNAPGTPSSIATVFDGYPMTRQGRSDEAIIGATIGSVIGGLIGVLALLLLAPPLASFALRFGPPEYFWIAVLGLSLIASLSSGSLLKGLIGGTLGMLIATIGIAPLGGGSRFTFGVAVMQGGVPFIPAMIGIFVIPEALLMMARSSDPGGALSALAEKRSKYPFRAFGQLLAKPINAIRSALIGVFVGILPGAGGNVASLIAYNEAKRSAGDPDEYGKGNVQGVIASESANNAVVAGSMVPLLTLGVPGAPPDAIIYGVLLIHGLRPGPDLFTEQSLLTYTFILSMGVAALLMAPIGLLIGRALQRAVVRMPLRYLAPGIILLSMLGSYAIRNSTVDVLLMIVVGLLGLGMRLLGFHPGPIILGLILGPIAEQGLVQGMLIGAGREHAWTIFVTRPLSLVIISLIVLFLVWPLWRSLKQRRVSLDPQSEDDK